jgi:hypothetical protein
MAFSFSSPLASDIVPSKGTTVVQAVDVYAERQKKRYQTALLVQHKMLLSNEDFSLLVQSNLMDELIQVIEDIDPAAKATYYKIITSKREYDNIKKEKNDVDEGADKEDSVDDEDEDEDYKFELSDEEQEEDNDTKEQNKHNPSNTTENEVVVHMDISTQTQDQLDYVFSDMEVPEQQNIHLCYTSSTGSFHDP